MRPACFLCALTFEVQSLCVLEKGCIAFESVPEAGFGMQGYFLETCPKMRYKADFHPSELLCMRTYAWVPLPIALPALKADSHCAIGLVSVFSVYLDNCRAAIPAL